jgi:hypothetical protein
MIAAARLRMGVLGRVLFRLARSDPAVIDLEEQETGAPPEVFSNRYAIVCRHCNLQFVFSWFRLATFRRKIHFERFSTDIEPRVCPETKSPSNVSLGRPFFGRRLE